MPDTPIQAAVPPAGIDTVDVAAREAASGSRMQTISVGSEGDDRVVDAIAVALAYLRQMDNQPPRALLYARDVADRMRVVVDQSVALSVAGSVNANAILWGAANVYPAWYSTGAPNSMDQRETQREMSRQTFQAQRARWTIT